MREFDQGDLELLDDDAALAPAPRAERRPVRTAPLTVLDLDNGIAL
jgi:hypothetical protein